MKAKVTAVFGTGKSTNGTPFIAMEFETENNERLEWRGYLSDKAAKRTIESLRYLGWQGSDITAITEEDCPCEVDITIDESEYNGKTYRRVGFVNSTEKGGSLGDSEQKALAARLRGLCLETPVKAPF